MHNTTTHMHTHTQNPRDKMLPKRSSRHLKYTQVYTHSHAHLHHKSPCHCPLSGAGWTEPWGPTARPGLPEPLVTPWGILPQGHLRCPHTGCLPLLVLILVPLMVVGQEGGGQWDSGAGHIITPLPLPQKTPHAASFLGKAELGRDCKNPHIRAPRAPPILPTPALTPLSPAAKQAVRDKPVWNSRLYHFLALVKLSEP